MTKSPAQLDAEIAEALAKPLSRSSPSAAAAVQKLRASARRLVNKQREGYDQLRDAARTIGRLAEIADDASTFAERTIAAMTAAAPGDTFWTRRLDAEIDRARREVAELRALQDDPTSFARTARQRFSADTSPDLATALYYLSALDGLAGVLRKIEAIAERGA